MIKNVICAVLVMLLTTAFTEEKRVLFPTPVQVEWLKGVFHVGHGIKVTAGKGVDAQLHQFLADHITSATESKKSDCRVYLSINDQMKNREAYKLTVTDKAVTLIGGSNAGLFYGIQTLGQLIDEQGAVPAVKIYDYPRFGWRGLHLDVSRHFFGKAFIKRYIDLMALYKYNVFHWHLTDDDGWRIESKMYPKLTEVGAWRDTVGRSGNQAKGLNKDDGSRYGGFYSYEDMKEIVAYASARHISILPEIDVPGHSRAIVRSYPEFGTHPGSDVLNIANPETIKFLEDIYGEIGEIFPFEYIHIGCDEVGLGAWRRNAACQAKIKAMNLGDEHGLHRWLVHHLQQFLEAKGKKAIAWCEVLDCKVDSSTAIMAWRDNGGWVKAPRLGHEVVVTPSMQTYFNYQEDVSSNAPGHGGYRTVMEKVYNFDPVDQSLTDEQRKLILGGQGCIWTECIPLPEHVEYIAFPRAVALSEALWSPLKKKNWSRFKVKIDQHLSYLDRHKVLYRVAAPLAEERKFRFIDKGMLKLTNPNLRGTMHYTVDGSEPTADAPVVVQGAVPVVDHCTVKAVVILPNGRKSYTTAVECIKEEPKEGLKVKNLEHGLYYRTFPSVKSVEKIQRLQPLKSGFTTKMSAFYKSVVEFSGYLKLDKAGSYSFKVSKHSHLFLGIHSVSDESQSYFLGKGLHPVTIISMKGKVPGIEMKFGDNDFAPVFVNHFYAVKGQRNVWMAVKSPWKPRRNYELSQLFDHNPDRFFWLPRGPKQGESMTFSFNKAVMADKVRVETGKPKGGDILKAGILEVSEDGVNFVKANDITGGVGEFAAKRVKAFRIKCTADQGNWMAIKAVEISSPEIY